MKTTIKTVVAIAFVAIMAVTTTASAQKIGYINVAEVIQIMPDMKTATAEFETYAKEIQTQFQALNSEFSTKSQDFGAKSSTYTDLIRQQKEKELQDLATRIQEFEQAAQADMQKKQDDLMAPIVAKVKDALTKVSKENSILFVLDTANQGIPYYNEAAMTNMLPLVKKSLGLQ